SAGEERTSSHCNNPKYLKSEISKLQIGLVKRSPIRNFGFEMQESSDFKFSRAWVLGNADTMVGCVPATVRIRLSTPHGRRGLRKSSQRPGMNLVHVPR